MTNDYREMELTEQELKETAGGAYHLPCNVCGLADAVQGNSVRQAQKNMWWHVHFDSVHRMNQKLFGYGRTNYKPYWD